MKKKPDGVVVDFGLANLARDHGVPVPAGENRRKIKTVWADEIALEIDRPGLVDVGPDVVGPLDLELAAALLRGHRHPVVAREVRQAEVDHVGGLLLHAGALRGLA